MNNPFKLALLGALCALPSVASACSCAPPPAPKVALANSAAVFVGRVTSVEKGESSNKFQFAVSKQWKGIKGKSASIVTATNSAACGINFDSDRDYLVYAFKLEGDDQLRTNLCTRTTRAADASADMAELGAPVKQTNAANTVSATDYPISSNGVVQINARTTKDKTEDAVSLLLQTIQSDRKSQLFRMTWDKSRFGSSAGTALYNRADSTLKVYSRLKKGAEVEVRSTLYSGITDEVLKQTATSLYNGKDFMPDGVTKKDMGSKTVSVSG